MTRRSIPKPKRQVAPAVKPVAPRLAVSPLDLARAAAGDPARATQTSLSLATAEPVDTERYSAREQQAAKAVHAMDYGFSRGNATDALSFVSATGWPGFQTLSLLAQLPEYRTMHETLADEVVRTWGKVVSTSKDAAAADKITQITQKLEQLNVRSLIRTAVIHDQAYGGAHVFPHLRSGSVDVPADSPLLLTPAFVTKGCLQAFSCVEPMWLTPNAYNATDPTKPNFYKPSSWYMLSTIVHTTRLFTMISRPVGDMLKAAYSFRGVSVSQLAMPYVDNWLRTRQSVSDTVKQFSITYLKMDMAQLLAPGGAQSLQDRLTLFNLNRDNRNVGAVDMTTEDFAQINTPLSGLDALQAQSQEQMAAVSHIPLVKLTGITPAGLNANSDGEIRVWYDFVAGYQVHNTGPLMEWILDIVQLSEFGEIDPGLSWDWNPLYELTDLELADVREKNARTDQTYLEAQIVSGDMVAQRLAQDPNSGYAGILADRDALDEVHDLAESILAEATTPQPQAPIDEPDADQPDAQAEATGGDRAIERS
ncbi:portal protein [Xanthomonas phage NEB7]|nr:portal protein [Xanthomonas phage NEB7]